ncbi:hypothetical protein [Asanoa siamensis]|uniref:MYXO-CTERM domain-containing protein n=1 Tax=Asanoa siamensis TaxID=926357 RepID=A0ABQ4CIB8_9ACTN|nr:hypothetical protein [Asanoa siamensis]GIF71040.1 hypothetical protein Asi02nite_05580 [Asanoa siamensis]
MIRSELGDSLEHLRAAAGHAVGGVNTAVRPRVGTARDFVAPSAVRVRDLAGSGWQSTRGGWESSIRPLASAAGHRTRDAARAVRRSNGNGSKGGGAKGGGRRFGRSIETSVTSRRWPIVAAIVVAGAAFGAAAIMRRRRQQQWDEYDPSRSLDAARSGGGGAGGGGRGHSHGRIGDAADAARHSVKNAAATARGAASSARSKAGERFSSTGQPPQTTDPTASRDHMSSPDGRS